MAFIIPTFKRTTLISSPCLVSARSSTTARTIFTSVTRLQRTSTAHVAPGDVVAHSAPGPVTVHETPAEITADVISDAPAELRYRPVRIYKATKNTMQSAKGKTKVWRIDWDVLQGAGRWENPLMGWASSADYMQGTTLAFRTKEDAVAFAERQGWDYQVQHTPAIRIPPKNYANNYVHVPGRLRIHHTK